MKNVKAFEDFRSNRIEEALDQKEVLNILDAAAMFADDAEVAANQTWRDRDDLIKYLMSDHIAKKDHKKFLKYVGESEEVNEGRVENEVLQKISKFETLLGYITNDDQYKPLVSKVRRELDKLKKQIKKNESVVTEATDSEMRAAIRAAQDRSVQLRDKETELRDKVSAEDEKGNEFETRMFRIDLEKNELQQRIAQLDIEKLQAKYRRNNE